MAIEGPLRELGIQDVFQLLDLTKKTGVLRVRSDLRQNTGTVVFERGAVIAARLEANPHRLGELLRRRGKVSDADLAHAARLQGVGDSRRLGDILIDLGAISRRELERQVQAQMEEVLFDLMGWNEGYFRFEEGAPDAAFIEAAVRVPTEALLMEAARRIDEWSRIEAKIGHLGVVPRLGLPDDGGGSLDLMPFEWELLAAVDGVRDLRALAQALGRSEFEVARTAYALVQAGLLEMGEAGAAPTPSGSRRLVAPYAHRLQQRLMAGDVAGALAVAEELAADHPGEAAASRLLGLAQAAAGHFDLAIESWERWRAHPARPLEEQEFETVVDRLRLAAATLAEAARGPIL